MSLPRASGLRVFAARLLRAAAPPATQGGADPPLRAGGGPLRVARVLLRSARQGVSMRIRIESDGTRVETTLAQWLEALRSVARSDAEFAAVLGCMLDDGRIRFLSEPDALAA